MWIVVYVSLLQVSIFLDIHNMFNMAQAQKLARKHESIVMPLLLVCFSISCLWLIFWGIPRVVSKYDI